MKLLVNGSIYKESQKIENNRRSGISPQCWLSVGTEEVYEYIPEVIFAERQHLSSNMKHKDTLPVDHLARKDPTYYCPHNTQ